MFLNEVEPGTAELNLVIASLRGSPTLGLAPFSDDEARMDQRMADNRQGIQQKTRCPCLRLKRKKADACIGLVKCDCVRKPPPHSKRGGGTSMTLHERATSTAKSQTKTCDAHQQQRRRFRNFFGDRNRVSFGCHAATVNGGKGVEYVGAGSGTRKRQAEVEAPIDRAVVCARYTGAG